MISISDMGFGGSGVSTFGGRVSIRAEGPSLSMAAGSGGRGISASGIERAEASSVGRLPLPLLLVAVRAADEVW